MFRLHNSAQLVVDGTFTKTGNGVFNVSGVDTTFQVGNVLGSSVEAGDVDINSGADVTIGNVVAHGYVDIGNFSVDNSLHVLNNFQQDGSDYFALHGGAELVVDGTFTKTGNGVFNVSGADTIFQVGNALGSSVEAGNVDINSGAQVTIGNMVAHGYVEIGNFSVDNSLHVLNNFQQDGDEYFNLHNSAELVVGGTFTRTGNGVFNVIGADTIFQVGNNFQQDGSIDFALHGAQLIVDGTFTKTGNGGFNVAGADTIFQVGNVLGSSVEAGDVDINSGAQVTIGNVVAHGYVDIGNFSVDNSLHVLNNFQQDGDEYFNLHNSSEFIVDGTFTKTGNGDFRVGEAATTFQVGNAAGSSIEAGNVDIFSGADVTIGSMTVHGFVNIGNFAAGNSLHVLNNFQQDGTDYFALHNGAQLTVDGSFSYTAGNTFQVRNNSVLSTGNTTSGMTVANSVLVDSGGQATIGHLTAHGNVTVLNAGSMLRVGGDYLQDAGGFAIGDGGVLNVDGSFQYTVGGPMFVNFGNGLLTVGDTLTLEDGHFWNLAASGGKVRVGEGVVVPAAGSIRVTDNGTLAGNGTVVGAVINTGGTISPGASPGRLDITGDYTQGAIAELQIEIGGTLAELQFDQLFISGAASLMGTLAVDLVDLGSGVFAPTLGQTFDVLKAGGGITGSFSVLDLPSLAGNLDWDVAYLTDRVRLSIVEDTGLAGDFNLDGRVNAADYVVWRKLESGNPQGYNDWVEHFGEPTSGGSAVTAATLHTENVPEPAAASLLIAGLISIAFTGRVRSDLISTTRRTRRANASFAR
jgi:hypothetical protein